MHILLTLQPQGHCCVKRSCSRTRSEGRQWSLDGHSMDMTQAASRIYCDRSCHTKHKYAKCGMLQFSCTNCGIPYWVFRGKLAYKSFTFMVDRKKIIKIGIHRLLHNNMPMSPPYFTITRSTSNIAVMNHNHKTFQLQ